MIRNLLKTLCLFLFILPAAIYACPTPTPLLSGDSVICAGTTLTYNVTNSTYYTSFTWSVTGGKIISGQGTKTVKVKWNDSGSASIKIVTQDNSACEDSAELSVRILKKPLRNDPPVAKSVCVGDTVRLTVPSCTGCSYVWKDLRYPLHPSVSTKDYHDYTPPQSNFSKDFTILFSVDIASPNGCTTRDTVKVTIKSNAWGTITGPLETCENYSSNYIFTYTNKPDSIKWDVEKGTILSGAGNDTVKILWDKKGTGVLTAVSYRNNCVETRSLTVNIYADPDFTIESDGPVCMGNIGKYSVPTGTAKTYSWSATGGVVSGSNTSNIVYIKWNTSGTTFKVTLKATQVITCNTTKSITADVRPKPTAAFTSNVTEICRGGEITFTNQSTNADSLYWDFGDGSLSRNADPKHTYSKAGLYKVKLKSNWPGNCADSVIKTITVFGDPQKQSVNGKINVQQNDTMLYYIKSTPGNTYKWNVVNGTKHMYGTTTDSFAIVIWSNTGQGAVEVTETNANGCTGETNALNVTVDKKVSVKNYTKSPMEVKVFPNPFNNELNIIFSAKESTPMQIIIVDITGRTLYTENNIKLNAGQNTISIDNAVKLPAGTYSIIMITGDIVTVKKVLKN